MKIYNNLENLKLDNTAIAIGKFDAIHLGHRRLISDIVEKDDLESCVIAINFAKESIFTRDERISILEKLKVDILIELDFDNIKDIEYYDFLDILKNNLGMKFIACGDDFNFGRGGKGNIESVINFSETSNIEYKILEKLHYKGKEISSSRIRSELLSGNMDEVNAMLGTDYFLRGMVVLGNQLGRTIGVPTANVDWSNEKVIPPFGVYASRVCIDSKIYNSISNIGVKPTVIKNMTPLIEVNIFDFDADIYGKEIEIYLYKFLRKENKYSSIKELEEAMSKDILSAKRYFLSN